MSDSLRKERRVAGELVSRVYAGDRRAEAEMVERYSRGLRFLLWNRTRDIDLADDLLQETWTVALGRLRSAPLENPARLAGFLSGIARHLALNSIRKAGRQRTWVNTDVIDLIPDPNSNPAYQVTRAETCCLVRQVIGELRQERDREILERFYVREQDKEEICERIGVDGSHFNRVLYRARQRLRKLLEKKYRRRHLGAVR